jgi:glutathione synthase
MKIAFQMEPLTGINPKTNSSAHLLLEALRRKHKVFHYQPQNLSLKNGKVLALAAEVKAWDKISEYNWIDLSTMDVVLVRQDPPFNINYITATYFLEQLPKKVRVLNNPHWIRNTPEKLAPLLFPDYVPPTLFTRDAAQLTAFYKEHKDIIIKPLYGHHGNGVFHLKPKDDNVAALIEYTLATSTEPWIAQPYIPEVRKGNLRVLFIDGAIVGAFKVVPEAGEFRLYRGSMNIKHTLTKYETTMCEEIGTVLKERGLFYVGIDIIGKFLIEINVTSTGSIDKYNALYGAKLEKLFWDRLTIY